MRQLRSSKESTNLQRVNSLLYCFDTVYRLNNLRASKESTIGQCLAGGSCREPAKDHRASENIPLYT